MQCLYLGNPTAKIIAVAFGTYTRLMPHLGYTHTHTTHPYTTEGQGRSQKFVLGVYFFVGGGIKLLNSRSDVILPHKKFTWADFGGIKERLTDIHPRRFAPAEGYFSDCYGKLRRTRGSDSKRDENRMIILILSSVCK